MPSNGLTREEWSAKFGEIGQFLRKRGITATVEIIGAWPVMEAGMPGRTSMDLDVWLPGSRFDRAIFREACLRAGLDFDPINETDRPYVQLIRPGIVHVPKHEPEYASTFGGLTVNVPPAAALIASKLVRGAAKDIDDALYLQDKLAVTKQEVSVYTRRFTDRLARETATENLAYLRLKGLPDAQTHRAKPTTPRKARPKGSASKPGASRKSRRR
jgi:hypothetical protein